MRSIPALADATLPVQEAADRADSLLVGLFAAAPDKDVQDFDPLVWHVFMDLIQSDDEDEFLSGFVLALDGLLAMPPATLGEVVHAAARRLQLAADLPPSILRGAS